jgi:hypothetical protein
MLIAGSKKKGSRRNFFAAALVVGPSILLSGEPALAFGTGIPGRKNKQNDDSFTRGWFGIGSLPTPLL